ncbi:MAG: hypothetical protein FJ303_23080 [Planctomycetes bacterium]|nr:hypothetical protein [Planctomycetota bacterium]
MVGTSRILFVSVVMVSLSAASTAHGFNGRFGFWRPFGGTSYYYTMPAYYSCVPTGPAVMPVPDAKPALRYANPVAAPPSSTAEPPLHNKGTGPMKPVSDTRMPVIVASHALPSTHVAEKPAIPTERCKVGFWNLTGRDVTLTIEGKRIALTKDRAVNLDLTRQFRWQIDGRALIVERVADGLATHEIVIRE